MVIATDIDGLGKETVFWLNDLTEDRRYTQWSPTVHELLTPAWPGTLKYIKKNLCTGKPLTTDR